MTTQRSNEKAESKITPKGYRLGTKAEDDIMKAALAMSEIEIPQSSCATRSSFTHPTEIPTDKPRERIVPIRVEGLGEEEEEEVTDEDDEDDNMQLARALELSLQDSRNDTDKTLKLRLDLTDGKTLTHLTNSVDEADEDDELRKALQLSLECVTAPPTPDPEDLRWRRLNHFGIYTNRTPNSEAPANLNT